MKFLRAPCECLQQGIGRRLSSGNVIQETKPLVRASNDSNRGGGILLCVSVAPSGRLNHTVHPGRKANDLLKRDIYTCFNDLG